MGRPKAAMSSEALETLFAYHFPGNIRELKNIIEHALIQSRGGIIRPEHLHLMSRSQPENSEPPPGIIEPTPIKGLYADKARELLIRGAFAQSGGDVDEASRMLGLSTMEIYRSLQTDETDLPEPRTDEEKIFAYLKTYQSLDNDTCRQLLSVDKNRASYLLRKMSDAGILRCEGSNRWVQYFLSEK